MASQSAVSLDCTHVVSICELLWLQYVFHRDCSIVSWLLRTIGKPSISSMVCRICPFALIRSCVHTDEKYGEEIGHLEKAKALMQRKRVHAQPDLSNSGKEAPAANSEQSR